MKISKLTHLIFPFLTLFSFAFGSEVVELIPAGVGGKLFCVQPGKTYCLNVVDYPRDQIDKLLYNVSVGNYDI